jgi:hypothetical protein
MALVGIQHVIQYVDIVICTRLRRDQALLPVNIHSDKVTIRVISDPSLGTERIAVEYYDPNEAHDAIEDPDNDTWPNKYVPLAVSKDLDMVVHGPECGNGQRYVRDEKELVVRTANTIERKR